MAGFIVLLLRSAADSGGGLVTVSGDVIVQDGRPLSVVGVNADPLRSCTDQPELTRGEIPGLQEDDSRRSRGVLRVPVPVGTDVPRLRRLLDETHDEGSLVVLVVLPPGCATPDDDWRQSGWRGATTWVTDAARTLSGSDAIAYWSVGAVEAQDMLSPSAAEHVAGLTAAVREGDPRHLVGASAVGVVDVCEIRDVRVPGPAAMATTDLLDACLAAGRPVVVGEFSLPVGSTARDACVSPTQRARALRARAAGYLDRGVAGIVIGTALHGDGPCDVSVPGGDPLAASVAEGPSGLQAGFLRQAGTTLTRDGEPFRFTGFNNYVMLGCGFPEERMEGRVREEWFASLPSESVVRLFLLPDADLGRFDEIVADAAANDVLLVVVLTDHLGGCGDTEKDDAFYAGGWKGEHAAWVRQVVPRHAASATIAFWELVNEPAGDAEALRDFYDGSGALVRSLDPVHLRSSGTLGPYANEGQASFERAVMSRGVDIVSMHEYEEIPSRSSWLDPVLEAARKAEKPVFIGEYGIKAVPEEGGDPCDFTFGSRAETVQRKLQDSMSSPEVAGALYWAFSNQRHTDCTLGVYSGDPVLDVLARFDPYSQG